MLHKLFGFETNAHFAWGQKSFSAARRKSFIDKLSKHEKEALKENMRRSAEQMDHSSNLMGRYTMEAMMNVVLDAVIQKQLDDQKMAQDQKNTFTKLGL